MRLKVYFRLLLTSLLLAFAFYFIIHTFLEPKVKSTTRINLSEIAEYSLSKEQILSFINEVELSKELKTKFPTRNIAVDSDFNDNFLTLSISGREEDYLNYYSKKVANYISTKALELRKLNSITIESQIKDLTVKISLANDKLEDLQKQISKIELNNLISEYQELSVNLGSKHPKMLELAKEISRQEKRELTHSQILAFKTSGKITEEQLQQSIEASVNNLNKLEEEKLRLVTDLTLKNFRELKIQPETIFISRQPVNLQTLIPLTKKSFYLAILLFTLLVIKEIFRNNFRDSNEFSSEMAFDSDKIFPFPKLPNRMSDEKALPSPDLKQLSIANNFLPQVLSDKLLPTTKENFKSNEQQTLETLAADLIINSSNKKHNLYLFTSHDNGDGNTTVVSNLGVAFSNISEKVLLIDANFDDPSLSQKFGLQTSIAGLSDLILNKANNFSNYIVKTQFAGLDLLPVGSQASAANKFLSSAKISKLMRQLSKDYDYILIDGGGFLNSAGGRLLANQIGNLYLVVNAEKSARETVKKTLVRLEKIKVKLEGVILNQAKS